jgi:ABC-type transporter Mla MlaB component
MSSARFAGPNSTMGAEPPRASALEIDVSGVTADVAIVDLLARMALCARRRGCALLLRGAAPELVELIDFAGLAEVLRTS